MVAKAGGNPASGARQAGGGSGRSVQGRSKGSSAPANMARSFKPAKQVGGGRNAPKGGK